MGLISGTEAAVSAAALGGHMLTAPGTAIALSCRCWFVMHAMLWAGIHLGVGRHAPWLGMCSGCSSSCTLGAVPHPYALPSC
jgi:hypothetical protein